QWEEEQKNLLDLRERAKKKRENYEETKNEVERWRLKAIGVYRELLRVLSPPAAAAAPAPAAAAAAAADAADAAEEDTDPLGAAAAAAAAAEQAAAEALLMEDIASCS